MSTAPPLVELAGVDKRLGGVHALRGVDLAVAPGTVHALVGENGAGKSTVGNVIAGVHSPDGGELRVAGEAVHFRSPRDAIARGITIVEQEIALVGTRSVLENVFLGLEELRLGLVRRKAMRKRFDELCESVGIFVDPDLVAGQLPIGQQQKVEVLRGLARRAQLIVMDEPTAALTAEESAQLRAIVRRLRERGTTIVYVSHFLEEVIEVADAITVLRDGAVVRSDPVAEVTKESLVTSMLGRPLERAFPAKSYPPPQAPVLLSVRDLSRGKAVHDVSFDVRAGEIVGLAGLVGSGRSEIARAIFGADKDVHGSVEVGGRAFVPHSPGRSKRRGIAFVPESRKELGLLMRRGVGENMSLAHLAAVSTRQGVVSPRRERRELTQLAESMTLPTDRMAAPVATLSGGNQQKVMFAKWLLRRPEVLIVDEPTRGVDVGAKRAIYDLVHGLAEEGVAVLMISSEIEEILGLAHRVLVVRGGRVVSELAGEEASEHKVMEAAFGHEQEESAA